MLCDSDRQIIRTHPSSNLILFMFVDIMDLCLFLFLSCFATQNSNAPSKPQVTPSLEVLYSFRGDFVVIYCLDDIFFVDYEELILRGITLRAQRYIFILISAIGSKINTPSKMNFRQTPNGVLLKATLRS